jgi:SAM-dependent methyltransferase
MANFIPGEAEWVRSHYYDVPNETVEFCGDLSGKSVLNLGCGEMLTDFGLLNQNVKQIVGLDLDDRHPDHLLGVVEKLQRNEITPPEDYAGRILYRHYDGVKFPFADGEFDLVFSWSAFEHVTDVPAVLAEVYRVLTPDGRAFVQVHPWYQCYWGSHLSDYIAEPYFHLKRSPEWIREELERYVAEHPESRDMIMNYMYGQYRILNGYSANHFYRDVMAAGFKVVRSKLISYELDLSDAPPETDFSDLMICGTKMLLAKRDLPAPAAA